MEYLTFLLFFLLVFPRFGDALRVAQDNMDHRNFYGYNPAFDKVCKKNG